MTAIEDICIIHLGRCGIPINISNVTYYLTPGKTYNNVNGKKVKVNSYIKFKGNKTGIKAQDTDYLGVVTNDSLNPTLYEGWDYITNNLAGILAVAVDKDTGNIISVNNITYSEFKIVDEGVYNKQAWEIDGYTYLGNISRTGIKLPFAPVGVQDTSNSVTVNISAEDVDNGVRKQVVFVYEKSNEQSNDKEVRISIYNIQNGFNTIMYTGKYTISEENILEINIYDKGGIKKYYENINYDLENGYIINTQNLENNIGINLERFEYIGHLIKSHPEYFLNYIGEELEPSSGDIYNLKEVGENKVHIILGYKETIPDTPQIDNGIPELKVSYVDEKGSLLPGKESKETKESIGKDIVTKAEDFRSEFYMYVGYMYWDTQNKFSGIITPFNIKGKEDSVTTRFNTGNDRRHIIFIYKKIDLKFEIDIIMDPNDLENQYIGQKEDEDYWVLDNAGKVYMKVKVTGAEGLNILNYAIKLKVPFDIYMNGNFVKANSINNLTVKDLSNVIIADRLIVPIWVEEKKYNLSATIEANIDGFGIFSANKQDDVEVVGRLYDFTVTNIDGSKKTGDEKWKSSLFSDENNEYKASAIPIGQVENQPEKYKYGIKLGTTFYYSVNTKGLKNDSISIVPKFIYVSQDGSVVKEVDIYYNDNGKLKNILSNDLSERHMKLRDDNILKASVRKEVERAIAISKFFDRYNYATSDNNSIGTLANTILSKPLSLPCLNYINDFKDLYGVNAIELSNKTENELLVNAAHWYGKYVVPASSKIIDKGASLKDKTYDDGYLIVCFKIITLDSDGKEYLGYDLPTTKTQWERENLNQNIDLPAIVVMNSENKTITLETLKEGYAPVIIYQIGVSVSDNNTSVGTH